MSYKKGGGFKIQMQVYWNLKRENNLECVSQGLILRMRKVCIDWVVQEIIKKKLRVSGITVRLTGV